MVALVQRSEAGIVRLPRGGVLVHKRRVGIRNDAIFAKLTMRPSLSFAAFAKQCSSATHATRAFSTAVPPKPRKGTGKALNLVEPLPFHAGGWKRPLVYVSLAGYTGWAVYGNVQRDAELAQVYARGTDALAASADDSSKSTLNQVIANVLRAVPNRAMSRAMGFVSTLPVPVEWRAPVYSKWMALVGATTDDMAQPDLRAYATLGELFVRRMRPEARPVDPRPSVLVSPTDGRVLVFRPVESRTVQQVKGASYDLMAFLGEPDQGSVLDAALLKHTNKNTQLYQCVIYLSPSDYHRFHAPADVTFNTMRHFAGTKYSLFIYVFHSFYFLDLLCCPAGELLSVHPGVTNMIRNLFVYNERLVFVGKWAHGFFGYAAVGATNVGSISTPFDPVRDL